MGQYRSTTFSPGFSLTWPEVNHSCSMSLPVRHTRTSSASTSWEGRAGQPSPVFTLVVARQKSSHARQLIRNLDLQHGAIAIFWRGARCHFALHLDGKGCVSVHGQFCRKDGRESVNAATLFTAALNRHAPFSRFMPALRRSSTSCSTKEASPPVSPSQTLASDPSPTRTRQRRVERAMPTQSASWALPSEVCVCSVLIK